MVMICLITGGTGSFGYEFVKQSILENVYSKIIIFSRDEHKQEKMREYFHNYEKLRFIIGDVFDEKMIKNAIKSADIVYHAAAMKIVASCEYNPVSSMQTNVIGTINVIEACRQANVKQATFISTDKAVYPINIYGKQKAASESLWINANNYKPVFNIIRYGNVMGSNSSVLAKWRESIKKNKSIPLQITSQKATRFWVNLEQAVFFAKTVPFVPWTVNILKSRAFSLPKLATALYKQVDTVETGLMFGEKVHETLVSSEEMSMAVSKKYGIVEYFQIDLREPLGSDKELPPYTSKNAPKLSYDEIRQLLR
jgi:FlaA1/EpsC-like NDP-sugar epimerase